MNIKKVATRLLKPYDNNAKKHTKKQIKQVSESIKECGMVQPIVCDKDNVVIIGHCRLMACKLLEMEYVPVLYVEGLTDAQIKGLRLRDNKLNESDWDKNLLALELIDEECSSILELFTNEIGVANSKEDQKKQMLYEAMELQDFEHYDYIVFVFNNSFDFMNIVQEFDLKKVKSKYNDKKIGLGRVVHGEKLIQRLGL